MGGRLTGEVAIVTGSTRGLGREIARVFAEEGAAVIVTGRDTERGERVAADLRGLGSAAVFIPADLALEQDCQRLVGGAVRSFGRLSILVNNAYSSDAIADDRPVGDLTTAAWESILRVNLTAVIWMCRFAVVEMRSFGGGSIVPGKGRLRGSVQSHGQPSGISLTDIATSAKPVMRLSSMEMKTAAAASSTRQRARGRAPASPSDSNCIHM